MPASYQPICTARTAPPLSWYGTSESDDGRIALICSYCPTRKEGEAAAQAQSLPMSHGICPSCFPAAMAEAMKPITP